MALRGHKPELIKCRRPKILIFGKAGVGKTWVSTDFPGAYYLDTEGGATNQQYVDKLAKAGASYVGRSEANNFEVIADELRLLATSKHNHKTFILDSASRVYGDQISSDYDRMKSAGRDMDKTFGSEKKGAINAMRRISRWIEMVDMNVILICHEKSLWRDGKEVGVTFDCWERLDYDLDLILHITKTGSKRNARITKSRLKAFEQDAIFPWSYEQFAKLFGVEYIEKEAAPVPLASPAQIEQYNHLLKVMLVEPKVLEKWNDNCADLEDLDAPGMQKRIDFLLNLVPKAEKGKVA